MLEVIQLNPSYVALMAHGYCYLWNPKLVGLHALSDSLIALAYFSIPIALIYFTRQRRDLPYPWLFQLFSAFIIACGSTHLMEVWTLWHPTYWVSGALKALTAIVSLSTAGVLIPVIPQTLLIPSRAELEATKAALEDQVRERTQALSASEARYKFLLNTVEGIVWELDLPSFQFTFVSQKAENVLGYPVEQWLTEPHFWRDHIYPDDLEAAIDICDRMTQALKDHEMEYRMIAADGRVVWLWDLVKVFVEGDRPVKLQGIMVDISDRKAAEQALHETNRRFHNLAANIPGAVFRYVLQSDGSDAVLYMSPGCYRLWEVEAGVVEADATILWQMIHPDDRVAMYESVLTSARTLQPWSWSWRIISASGQQKWLEAAGRPERQENGDVIWDTVILDVTARKQVEFALQHSENRLQLALEAADEGLWDWNLETGNVYLNARYEEILGYSRGEIKMDLKVWENLIHPDDKERAVANLNAYLDGTTTQYAFDYRLRCKSGEWKWIANFGKIVAYDDQHNPLRMVGIHIDITDRKAAEAALAESQQRYQDLIENSPDIIERFDLQLRHLYVSPALTRITGIPAEVFLGKTCRDLSMDTEMVNSWEAAAAQLLRTGQRQTIEFSTPTLQGIRTFEMAIAPELSEHQEIESILCISRDITDRKASEQALKESEARWQFALEGSGDGVWDWNLETNEVFFSRQWKTMLGYEECEIGTRFEEWEERLHPDDRTRCYVDLNKHFNGETAFYQNERRMRCKDGSYKWILARGKLIEWTVDGKPARIIGTHTDITDRKQAAAALQASEERLRLALEAANQGLYDINLQTGEAVLSPEYIEMLGYTLEEFDRTDKGWRDRLHPDERDFVSQTYQEYINGNRANYQLEFRQRAKTGDYKWILSLGKIVAWDEDGCPSRMIGTHTDITARKLAETQLRDLSARLELAVQAAKMGIWDWDIRSNRLTWDDRIYELYGLDRSVSPTYQTWESIIHPDDLLYCQATIQRDLAEKNEGTIEFCVQRSDNTLQYIASYYLIQRSSDGQPIRLIGVNLDISDRKQSETQLRDLNDRLRLAIQAAKMGIWELDIVNNRITWDDRTYELYGLQPNLHPANLETWESVIHPEDVNYCRELTYQTLADKSEGVLSLRAILPDGNLRYIESYFLVQQNAQGQPLRMVGVDLDITERKRAEEERLQAEKLRLELRLLERILDSVLAGYWDWDIPNHREYMSPGLKRMLGYEDHELENVPETWQKLIFAEDLPGVVECFERHASSHGKEPYYNEVRYCHKDGSTIWVLCAGQVIEWDADGHPLRMVGCHVDITRLKQTEAQLQKSEAHLRQAQRISKLGSWEFDVTTEKITWSDQVFAIFGRDPAIGPPESFVELQQLIAPSDRDLHQANVARAVTTLQPYDIECRVLRTDGTLAYMQAKGEAIVNAAGQVVQLVGTVLDITERKQAEVQLQILSDRLTLALQAGAIGTWDWDLVNEVRWDERMYEIYGLQDLGRVALYQDWIRQVHPDDVPTVEAALQAAVRSKQDYRLEFRIRRTDGELRWIRAEAIVRRDKEGEALHMIGINYDITAAKQAEAKLLQTKTQLEASNHELEAFAYSVSHDLRAPLRAIDGFSKALLEDYGDRVDEDGKDYFDRIRRNVQRMGLLIDDLLRLSRVSRSEMQYTTVNLSALVQEQINDLQASEPERVVKFIVAPDAIVAADQTLMRVVICNLLENAWKFTRHHSCACIEFGIIETEAEPIYFIRDDGAGFDMSYVSKLFGVFQRLHGIDQFPGTGIGLATVQRAVHRHGGRVWAEAAIEQGATIYFTLPNQALITGG